MNDNFTVFSTVELISDNLPKVRNLIWDARNEWYDLGLELGLSQATLQTIKNENPTDVKACFREMLSEWLKMVNPQPSWVGLLRSLKEPSVGHFDLVKKIVTECKVYLPGDY